MKNKARYLGSVRFFKHLILFVAASAILLPIAGVFILLIQYWELKENYSRIVSEQQIYISRLEERLAGLEGQRREEDTDLFSGTEESGQTQETPDVADTPDEDMPLIPFSVDLDDTKYILVNDTHPLSQCFEPDLVETRNGQLVHKAIKNPLERMIDDANAEGLDMIICSAYRDYEAQAKLVEDSIAKHMKEGYGYTEAFWRAGKYLEMVGRSEHHTGLAVDLVGIAYQNLDEGHADTPEGIWLSEHAHEYGFILRYPKDKEELTGILYESWHFRYVGKQAAAFMKEHCAWRSSWIWRAERAKRRNSEKCCEFVNEYKKTVDNTSASGYNDIACVRMCFLQDKNASPHGTADNQYQF